MLDRDTGVIVEKTLKHKGESVRAFYASILPPVVVGIEAAGSMGWFLRLMEELAIECRVGHPVAIRKAESRRQKHDRRDAALLLQLLAEDRFPTIWMPSTELRDPRALLLHRHQWVRMRTRVQNALHALALAHGVRRGHTLWNREGQALLASLPLAPHTAHCRSELLALYQRLDAQVDRLGKRVRQVADERPRAALLVTHPGVGAVTALATEVFVGDPCRFPDGRAVASDVGMIPSEYSSGTRQRLGALSKQGNPFLRFLWCEAAAHAVRRDPDLQRIYRRKAAQKGFAKANVAAARKLGIRLWIMLRDQIDYGEFRRRGLARPSSARCVCGNARVGVGPRVTETLIGRPASLDGGSSHESSWSAGDRRDVWCRHRRDAVTRIEREVWTSTTAATARRPPPLTLWLLRAGSGGLHGEVVS